jgi:hypothetical protein
VLATAGFIVYAVQFSDFGRDQPSTGTPGLPPGQASPIAVRLANAMGRANLGRSHRGVNMGKVAPFAWDRMYVFAGESRADIQRRLGFVWADAPASVPRPGRRETLLVFVRGKQVAGFAFFGNEVDELGCLNRLGGYPRSTRFVTRFSAGTNTVPPEGFLSTAHVDAAERACLGAAHVSPD